MNKEIEIPEGYEARIEGNKVIIGLKESEEERIRRQTLKVLNYYKDEEKLEGRMPTEIDECIAWLEKHKEPQNTSASTMIPSCWSEPLGEQKPAERSEDERIRKEIIRIVDIWTNSSPVVNGIPRERLLAYLEKQKEQRPKEKTEKTIISEWSEEDESCWNLIWDILDGTFTASKEGYKKAADWFLKNCPKETKALHSQHHWKPSEEQMLALGGVLDYLEESGNEDADIIRELINDLIRIL